MTGFFLRILIIVTILASSCNQQEEILPAPSRQPSSPASPPAPQQYDQQMPSAVVSSEDYLFGEYRKLPFRILIPRRYDSTKQYPLHIFLHGMGERGTDNEKHLNYEAKAFQADSVRQNYPAFIVFPQCPLTEYWSSPAMISALKGLVDTLLSNYSISEKHLSIGGFSMGAYGTFSMVEMYPDLFQLAIAISGDGNAQNAALMARPKWRIFAGKRDAIVPSSATESMARALSEAGASVLFTLYPHADHGGTVASAFRESDYFRWMFAMPAPAQRSVGE